MNREDLTKIAREAGLAGAATTYGLWPQLEAFAKIVESNARKKKDKGRYFFVELTDGEEQYLWVERYKVLARTSRGAMYRVAKARGTGFRKVKDDGHLAQYLSTSGRTRAFVEAWEERVHGTRANVSEDLS